MPRDAEKRRQYKADYYRANRERIAEYKARYQQENRATITIKSRQYVEANREKVSARLTKYRENNREKLSAVNKDYYTKNRESIRAKAKEYRKRRRAQDAEFDIVCRLRTRLYQALRAASESKKSKRTFVLVGCSPADLVKHLESLFLPGMSWDNRSEWHIDHIRPCASFDLKNPEEQAKCFHYSNLQPLWARDNLVKNAKYNSDDDQQKENIDDSEPTSTGSD